MPPPAPPAPRRRLPVGPLLVATLAAGLLAGGIRPAEAVILGLLGALVAVWAVDRRAPPHPVGESPPTRIAGGLLDLVVVAAATGTLAWDAASLPLRDQPLGLDTFAYLQNAIAVDTGNWALYERWRGPLHAWLGAQLARPAGGLLEATQGVSLVSAVGQVPLTWWLGRRLLGRWPALLGAVMVAGWPELRLFARFSTPYPLLAFLFTAGVAMAAAASRGRASWALPAGVMLGLAILTDVRAGPLTATVVLALLLGAAVAATVRPGEDREREVRPRRLVGVALVVGLAAWAVAAGTYATLPIELTPLAEQVALQRDLNATSLPSVCASHGTAFPGLAELLDACAQATLLRNVGRLQDAVPVSVAFLAAVPALGVLGGRHGQASRPVLLALPLLPLLPSALLVGVQHRYLLPVAPLVALLGAVGLAWLARACSPSRRPPARRLAGALATAIAAVVVMAWATWPGTPLARLEGGAGDGQAPSVVLTDLRGPTLVRGALRGQMAPGDVVVDCAKSGQRVRLYPTPVVEPRRTSRDPNDLPAACVHLRDEGPDAAPPVPTDAPSAGATPGGATWLVLAYTDPAEVAPAWELVASWPRGVGHLGLFRAR